MLVSLSLFRYQLSNSTPNRESFDEKFLAQKWTPQHKRTKKQTEDKLAFSVWIISLKIKESQCLGEWKKRSRRNGMGSHEKEWMKSRKGRKQVVKPFTIMIRTPATKVAIMFHQEETNHNKDNASVFFFRSRSHPFSALYFSLAPFCLLRSVCRSDKYLGAVDEY